MLGWTLFDPSYPTPFHGPLLRTADLAAFLDLASDDPDILNEWAGLLVAFEAALTDLELQTCPARFSAFVQIDGTSEVIATLQRTFVQWAEERAFTCSLIHEVMTEDAEPSPSQVTLFIDGPFAFGRLCESGPPEVGVSIIPDIDDHAMPPLADADLHLHLRRHNYRSGHT